MTDHKDTGISIQVGLSGYSFKVQSDGAETKSDWKSAEHVFTTKELQRRYDRVELAVFTPKCALVPAAFHNPDISYEMLSEVAELEEGDSVDFIDIPQYSAVLIYSNAIGETLSRVISETVQKTDGDRPMPLPEQYFMLRQLSAMEDFNKILASYVDGYLYLAVAQGNTLLLCNSFEAPDFTTAEYFIFMVLKKLQLNPEVSSISFRTPLTQEQELSLYRYFKSVDRI